MGKGGCEGGNDSSIVGSYRCAIGAARRGRRRSSSGGRSKVNVKDKVAPQGG